MGGYASGRHGRRSTKARIEDVRAVLNVRTLERRGLFRSGKASGVLQLPADEWRTPEAIGYSIDACAWCGELTLRYGGYQAYPINVEITLDRIVGHRWWFCCPACARRCVRLYRPPGTEAFECRTCHGLVYASSQTHDPRESQIRQNPAAALAYLYEVKSGRIAFSGRAALIIATLGI